MPASFSRPKKGCDYPRPLPLGANLWGSQGSRWWTLGRGSRELGRLELLRQAQADLVRIWSLGATPLLVLTLPTQIQPNAAPSGVLVSEERVMAQMGPVAASLGEQWAWAGPVIQAGLGFREKVLASCREPSCAGSRHGRSVSVS